MHARVASGKCNLSPGEYYYTILVDIQGLLVPFRLPDHWYNRLLRHLDGDVDCDRELPHEDKRIEAAFQKIVDKLTE